MDEPEPRAVPQSLTATIANGTAATGAWRKLTFSSVNGVGATINAQGDLAFTATGPATMSINITGQTDTPPATFAVGRSFNNGSIGAIGTSANLPDADPVTLNVGASIGSIGQTMQLYVFTTSTDPLVYSAGSLSLLWELVFPASADAGDFNATPPMPIDPGGNTPPPIFPPSTGPGANPPTGGNFPYTLALPTFRSPLVPLGSTFNRSQVPPFIGASYPFTPTPPASLAFNRVPPFPAYPT